MRTKDHYEMREYNIDVIQDGHDSHDRAKGRPYPIYPSKGGLNPSFLRDIISRFVFPTWQHLLYGEIVMKFKNELCVCTVSEYSLL